MRWSSVAARRKYSKITSELKVKLHNWILRHPHVIKSPYPQDTLLWKKQDGTVERIPKILISISIRELHNDMLKKESDGGLDGAVDTNGNAVISDTSLRDNLPFNLRALTERHKQVCGCEVCTVVNKYHNTLKLFRYKRLKKLKSIDGTRADAYESALFRNGKVVPERASDARQNIMCPPVEVNGAPHHKWKCVIGQCNSCPKYKIPNEETGTNADSPHICFHTYEKIPHCTKHGYLGKGVVECSKCVEIKNSGGKAGKVRSLNTLVKRTESIGKFHTAYYKPMLLKYRYHAALVKMLSKSVCYLARVSAFKGQSNDIMTRRDYAERLLAKFNEEIQSTHFGQGTTLSIEGCYVEFKTIDGAVRAHFHSHMSDKSTQDAATTHAHLSVLLNKLSEEKQIKRGESTMWDHTDGCTKQYRCAKALYLLSCLAAEFDIIIDRLVDAPGHGKDVVDGMNAQDKVYLRHKMITATDPNQEDDSEQSEVKFDAALCDGEQKPISFAEQCVKICSAKSRKTGVESYKKSKKREGNKKVLERFYHLQKQDDVKHQHGKYKLKGLDRGEKMA